MTAKKKQTLEKRIHSIEQSLFDEDDVKLFLIEIRDSLLDEKILKEICDFVAHPTRKKGICHKRIDSRYAKQKFIKNGVDELIKKKVFENNFDKQWRFFSDKILSYIQTEKIEKNLFELIIKEGIEEIGEDLFIKYYKINKPTLKKLIEVLYKKEKGFYILDPTLEPWEKKIIDDILKFIRGTITGKPAFEQSDIETEIINAIKKISAKNSISINLELIEKNMDDLIVCILCILHDSHFDLFDKSQAEAYLSIHHEENSEEFYLNLNANSSNFHFPIIGTKILATKYLDSKDKSQLEADFNSLKQVIASRNKNGALKLTEKYDS